MKTQFSKLFMFFLLFFGFLCINTLTSAQNNKTKEWVIPAEYKAMKNPLKKTNDAITYGKEQYIKYCAACHGNQGKGDGEKAKNFANIKVANLALDKSMNDVDGEHFYKIKIGRDNLHSFKGKIDDETIWSIIHYMKTFKKE